jgi:hypothetical protein
MERAFPEETKSCDAALTKYNSKEKGWLNVRLFPQNEKRGKRAAVVSGRLL